MYDKQLVEMRKGVTATAEYAVNVAQLSLYLRSCPPLCALNNMRDMNMQRMLHSSLPGSASTAGLAPTVYDKQLVEMRKGVTDIIREVLTFRFETNDEIMRALAHR